MSAFFVTCHTIDDTVTALHLAGLKTEKTVLGKALYRLNAMAMQDRYGDSLEQYESEIAAYEFTSGSSDLVQLAKSVHCYLYQTLESDAALQNRIIKKLIRYSETLDKLLMLNGKTIGNHPRWNSCQWDRQA